MSSSSPSSSCSSLPASLIISLIHSPAPNNSSLFVLFPFPPFGKYRDGIRERRACWAALTASPRVPVVVVVVVIVGIVKEVGRVTALGTEARDDEGGSCDCKVLFKGIPCISIDALLVI